MAYYTSPRHFFEDLPMHIGKKSLLCEGDSWFSIPDIANIPVQLDSMLDAAILCMADPGDTLEDLAEGWQSNVLKGLVHNDQWGHRWDAILLSAGGNDVIGPEIINLLSMADAIGRNTDDVASFLDEEKVSQMLATLKKRLLLLKRMRDESEINRDTPIFIHTYNCLTPRNKAHRILAWKMSGPWVWPYLVNAGIVDCGLQQAVVKLLIDRFHGVLMEIQNLPNANFLVIDCRETLKPGSCKKRDTDGKYWRDEIHPSGKGFAKIVRENFLPALRQVGI